MAATRRWRILRWGLLFIVLFMLTAVVLYVAVLPGYVGGRIESALREAGVKQVSFKVGSVTWRSTRLEMVSLGGPEEWLAATSIEADYGIGDLWNLRVDRIVLTGAEWTVRERDGRIDWGWPRDDGATSTHESELDLPLREIELRSCTLVLDRGDVPAPILVELDGKVSRLRKGHLDWLIDVVVGEESRSVSGTLSDKTGTVDVDMVVLDGGRRTMSRIDVSWARMAQALPHLVEARFDEGPIDLERLGIPVQAERVSGHVNAELDADFLPIELTGDVNCQSIETAGMSAREVALELSLNEATVRIRQGVVDASEPMKVEGVELRATGTAGQPLVVFERRENGFAVGIQGGIRLASPVSLVGETMRAAINNLELETAATIGEGGLFTAKGQVDLGECALSPFVANSGTIVATVSGTNEISVQHAAIDLGPHGRFRADPFRFNPAKASIVADVACENLELASWLPLLSRDEITGEGQVQGRIQVVLNPDDRELPMSFGAGYLMADPPTGWVQVADPSIIEGLLADYDFGSADIDLSLTDLKDRIVSAMQDFTFDSLHIDFKPVDRDDALQIKISGKGRQGVEPIPIGGLTVNVNDFDRVFNDAISLKRGYDRLTD